MSSVSPRDWPRSVLTAATLISVAVLMAILDWAQVVLIPIALAVLITFVLSPPVTRLQHWGLPRVPAVILVVLVAATAVGGASYVVLSQVNQLANQLPDYRRNITEKIATAQGFLRGGALEKVQSTLDEIGRDLEEKEKREKQSRQAHEVPEPDTAEEEKPVPVEVRSPSGLLDISNAQTLTPLLGGIAMAGLVFVLVIFMLIKREDLRNRVVSVAGQSSLAITTKALDDAGRRISRYLAMQFLINATFGLAVGVGLFLLGVPYAVLWGLCAGVLRYIPYVGPWMAALLPIAVSLMTSPGWTQALLVVGLFIVLELVSNNLMEPLLYGHSVGLSEVAVILAAVFWTWLWGPVGLMLATPMTACLVVLGRYIPALSFLDRLLGERPALKPHVWLYQRLLARDEDEASEIVEHHAAEFPLEITCDELLLPTVALMQRDRSRGHISQDDEAFILRAVQEIVEESGEWRRAGSGEAVERAPADSQPRALVLGFPARDHVDELALRMLVELVDPAACEFEILSPDALISENVARVEAREPACICLVSVPPGDRVQTRQICKRLRSRFPRLRIIAGRLGRAGLSERDRDALLASGADRAVGTLSELRQALLPIVQFHQQTATVNGRAAGAAQGLA